MLHVHRAERADRLADGLAELLATAAAGSDPFAEELVAVPAKGVERWLAQRLATTLGAREARTDGICANVRFPSPATVADEVLAAVTGVDRGSDPWLPERLVWPLLDVIDASVARPWSGPLALAARRPDRRFSVARHVADLFTSYASSRPEMMRSWARGEHTDGLGSQLGPDLRWQAELWQALSEALGTAGPTERLDLACSALQDPGTVLQVPARLSLFGPTRLSSATLLVVEALAVHRDVHLWLPHPSPALWDRVRALVPASQVRLARAQDPTAALSRHPLLASLGRDARELQLVLPDARDVHHAVHAVHAAPAAVPAGRETLLARLQHQIRDDFASGLRSAVDVRDRSIQVHACHGAARQVEVLREVIVGLLAGDPSLEPRDVLVMCPDIETFAPLISATFGLAEEEGRTAEHPAHRMRVRLADRALRQTNPVLGTLTKLLELADSRLTASQVLDLAATPPVRARFGFDDDDLERLHDWVARAGVRWGLDKEHRAPFHLAGFAQNTWRAGLDRILLGVAMSEHDGGDKSWLGLALPLDDVDSSDIDLAGRFAELLDRLGAVVEDFAVDAPLTRWLAVMSSALDSLTHVGTQDVWQVAQARRELADVGASAGERDPMLSLSDIRSLLGRRLRGRPTRANFRTGTLTVCTLVPMRSVPHRVVCLLGIDDGVFPRASVPDGDDILARTPCIGDRDARSEDRQLMLDAVLAATEHLVVTFTGADERTNAPRPPAVPLGELLDAIDSCAWTPAHTPILDQVVVRHPLQPFDVRNFTDATLGTPGPFSFDRTAWAGAVAGVRERRPRPPFLHRPLPLAAPSQTIDLESLIRFLEHPVRGFLRQRLEVSVLGSDDEPADSLAVELDALQKWAIGDRLLRDRLAGVGVDDCRQVEWRRGTLPPGPLGTRLLESILGDVEPIVAAARAAHADEASSLDVRVQLPDGRTVAGTVSPLHGGALVVASYSRLGPRQRLRAWTSLVALTAGRPGEQWRAVTIGKSSRGPQRSTMGPMSVDEATVALHELVDIYDQGMREPIPLVVRSSASFAQARHRGQSAGNALTYARKEWQGGDIVPGESSEGEHALVWGDSPAFEVLTEQPQRFAQLASALWDRLLSNEKIDLP